MSNDLSSALTYLDTEWDNSDEPFLTILSPFRIQAATDWSLHAWERRWKSKIFGESEYVM